MGSSIIISIVKTLAYSDVFDYPLTFEELYKFLIGEKIGRDSFKKVLGSASSLISVQNNLYTFKQREKIVQLRIQREKDSKNKLILAKEIALLLSNIPTVRFLGISGALAMENADKDDDIDFFIITQKGTLWLTRLLCLVLLEIKGVRRKRGVEKASNKVCLNMFMDEDNLSLSYDKRNLYTAHEVVQVKPLLNKNNTYQKFLFGNIWVTKFLPNSVDTEVQRFKGSKILSEDEKQSFNVFYMFEWVAKTVQLWYMKNHKTRETVTSTMLAFHPKDYQEIILKEYEKRLKKYEKV